MQVYLGQQYVNNPTLSDVTFVIEGRKFFAHRIALLASSDAFRAMFEGTFREKAATEIPIPNIRYEVFERMMHCIYTGAPRSAAELHSRAAAWGRPSERVSECCASSIDQFMMLELGQDELT